MPNIVKRGTNSRGNQFVAYDDGSYWHGNQDGSTHADDGKGHTHYTTPDGEDGWHKNANTGESSSGAQFRESDTRHARHNQQR